MPSIFVLFFCVFVWLGISRSKSYKYSLEEYIFFDYMESAQNMVTPI